jgi:hypothetical protein
MKHVKPLGPDSLAIITPYKEQMVRLREMIQDNLSSLIEVNTVDAFQGQEKDIIIFSCVRSKDIRGEVKGIGFLRDTRRLNVALTRAKYCLYTIGSRLLRLGCSDVLKTHSVWNNFLFHMNETGKYKRLEDSDEALETLQKLASHAKLRSDQLTIKRIEVKPYEKDPYLLGKRMLMRESSGKKDRGGAMMLEEIEVSDASACKRPGTIVNELDYRQKTAVPLPVPQSRGLKTDIRNSAQEKPEEKTPKQSSKTTENPASEPKTLRDLIKKPAASSKKKGQEARARFNLLTEVENFDFESNLLDG